MMDESRYVDARQRGRATRNLDSFNLVTSDEHQSAPVMVIDDSPAVRRVVEISLYRAGIPAVSFEDGLKAMAALQEGVVAAPKVLLLDIGLPRMNGYELARLFRSNPAFQQTRIIMLSAHDGVVDRTRSRLIGAYDFISKPFKAGELVRRIRHALGIDEWPGE